ncbi:unnamed protein product, partial [Effrenium voratum]
MSYGAGARPRCLARARGADRPTGPRKLLAQSLGHFGRRSASGRLRLRRAGPGLRAMGPGLGSGRRRPGAADCAQHRGLQHRHQCLCQGLAVAVVPAADAGHGDSAPGLGRDHFQQPHQRLRAEPALAASARGTGTAASEEAWPWALQLLSELPRAALRLDAVCCSAAICALGRGQKWQRCLELALGMGKVSQITGNTLVTAFQRSTQWTWVLCLLEQMESRTGNLACGADVITYASAIAACGDAGRWEACLELFARSEGSPAVLNAAIAGCGQSSQWQRSMQLLRGEVLPDIISYNSAITACGNAEQWQQALALLWEIPNQVPKDVVTLNAVLSCGLPWLLALQLFLVLGQIRWDRNRKESWKAALFFFVCVCLCLCERACVRACVRACLCVCVCTKRTCTLNSLDVCMCVFG